MRGLIATFICSLILASSKLCGAAHLEQIQKVLNIETFEQPQLDLSESVNGQIQLLGNFQDLNFYRYSGQNNFTGEVTNKTDQRLIYSSGDTLIELYAAHSNETFHVEHIVPLASDSFILSGTGSLSGLQLDHQLVLNLSTVEFRQIFTQALPKVNAITVVKDKVFFGGEFKYQSTNATAHSVVSWDYTTDKVELLPFGGFGSGSAVNSILSWNDQALFFAGNFSTLENSKAIMNSSNSSSSNVTVPELSTPLSLKTAEWNSTGSLQKDQLICPSSSSSAGWLQSDSSQGEFDVTLAAKTKLSKVRLYNSPVDDEQVSLFRILTSPSNGIMNLTYLDPSTGQLSYCDAWCPLYSTKNLNALNSNTSDYDKFYFLKNQTTLEWSESFQDFAFVDEVPISSLNFISLDSYGSSAGLSSFELYEDQVSVYANNTQNAPNCGDSANMFESELSSSSTWQSNTQGDNYVYTEFDSGKDLPWVNYLIDINYPGQYTINLLTPGCNSDNSCEARGVVNATVRFKSNNTLISTSEIYQTNAFEKYDTLYSGPLDDSLNITVVFKGAGSSDTSVMVAEKVEIISNAYDESVFDINEHGLLNGLLQYNLTGSAAIPYSEMANSTASLMGFTSSKIPKHANLFIERLEDTAVVLTSAGEMITASPNEDLEFSSIRSSTIGRKIDSASAFSNGLAVIGEFNTSKSAIALNSNGTTSNFVEGNSTALRSTNITLNGAEVLVFNDDFIVNVTSNQLLHNTSKLALSALSAGSNNLNDTLMQGSITRNQFTMLDGSFSIPSKSSQSSNFSDVFGGKLPYDAVFIDNSTTIYACYDPQGLPNAYNLMELKNPSAAQNLPYEWPNSVSALAYLKNESLLAMGLENATGGPQFILRNISTNSDVANYSWPNEASVNSFIFLERNTSVLVGGNYTDERSGCSGLCLFDYHDNKWSPFLNNSVNGVVDKMETFNDTLVISGALKNGDNQTAGLLSLSLVNGSSQIIKGGDEKIKDFAHLDENHNDLVVLSDRNVYHLTNGNWVSISSDFEASSVFAAAHAFPLNYNSSDHTHTNGTNAVIITGDIHHATYGSLNAFIYHSQKWYPFYTTSSAVSISRLEAPPALFPNRDISSANCYQGLLQSSFHGNTTSPSGSGNPSEPATPNLYHGNKRKRIDRGFVVLIGLALSMGTIAVLGTLAVALSYFFGDTGENYQFLKPRIDENEMIDTVPPEKLMKFI
ncbi:LAFA_0E05820g1_1 [Lachancea sp. 'fantastica']|nr:LAFA_0E05820g1_1 [Lachancea sp. 'fantastica']